MPTTAGVELHRVWAAGTELVFGARCPGCAAPGLGVCDRCRRLVQVAPLALAGLPLQLPVCSGGPYAEVLRELLLAAKERHALAVLPVLAERLSAAVAAVLLAQPAGGPVWLVPVPSAAAAVAERGVDLTGELARMASRRLRAAGVAAGRLSGLRLVRRPRDQAELGRAARLGNLAGAFSARTRLPAGELVVVDDIVTTGATLAEAVRALTGAGRPPLGAATVAAALRRDGNTAVGHPIPRMPH